MSFYDYDGKKLIRVYKILQKSCMDMILLSDIRSGMSTSFTVLYSNLDRWIIWYHLFAGYELFF